MDKILTNIIQEKIYRLVGYVAIFSLITPFFVSGIGLKIEDGLMPVVLLFLIIKLPIVIHDAKLKYIVILPICIFISMFLSNNLGLYNNMSEGYFNFPSEFYQTFKKTSLFLYFYLLISVQRSLKLEYLKFYRFVFFVAMIVGVVQILNIPGISEIFIKFYGSTTEQIAAAHHDLPQYSQIYGTAGNPITWGGLCVIIFYYFLFVESVVYYKYSGMLLAVINLIFASSRAGILSLLLSMIVLPLVMYLRERSFKKLFSNYFYAFSLLTLVFLTVQLLGSERLEFIKYRFFQLAISSDLPYNELDLHDRINQIKSGFDLLNEDKLNYFFGLGKPFVYMKIPWLESEFFYILTLYGILGIFLNYTFVFIIGSYGLKYYKEYGGDFIFIPTILLAYIIFSFGGYFIREYYSGLPFWIISGILLGSVNTSGNYN